jgi:hypothetical protein
VLLVHRQRLRQSRSIGGRRGTPGVSQPPEHSRSGPLQGGALVPRDAKNNSLGRNFVANLRFLLRRGFECFPTPQSSCQHKAAVDSGGDDGTGGTPERAGCASIFRLHRCDRIRRRLTAQPQAFKRIRRGEPSAPLVFLDPQRSRSRFAQRARIIIEHRRQPALRLLDRPAFTLGVVLDLVALDLADAEVVAVGMRQIDA